MSLWSKMDSVAYPEKTLLPKTCTTSRHLGNPGLRIIYQGISRTKDTQLYEQDLLQFTFLTKKNQYDLFIEKGVGTSTRHCNEFPTVCLKVEVKQHYTAFSSI